MAKVYKVNFQPATGAEAIYELKNVLTGSGWIVVSSSNGTTFGNSDLITGAAALTGSNTWFVVQEPSGSQRQWCFQRTTTNLLWRVKISPNATFTPGASSTTRVPAATDEGVILGSGTDASPTGGALFTTDNTYKFHIIADSTGIGPDGNKAFGFWAFANMAGASTATDMRTLICQEPLAVGTYPVLTGTRAATTSGEADPAVYAAGYNANGYLFIFSTGNAGFLGGATTETSNTFRMFYGYQNDSGSLTYVDDVYNGKIATLVPVYPGGGQDVSFPFFFGRGAVSTNAHFNRTTLTGFKGCSRFLRREAVDRSNGDTINLSTNAYVFVESLLIPWPEGVTPIF